VEIRFLGQSCFELTEGDKRLLMDPFLTGNPKAAAEPGELNPTDILLTHGHADHWGDIVDIAKRTGARCVAVPELANELGDHGVDNVSDPNLGGTVDLGGAAWVRLVPAWHTSTSPGGTVNTPTGMVVGLGGKVVYHLGDTAVFSDLRLVGERDSIDVALMCIGGHYTMDRHDAVIAAELVGARTVIPCHYDTFPPIETDVQAFKADVERRSAGEGRVAISVEILQPGETFSL
jgi:L-ascorbate metabolism protein UlaG (beta-lactamase superfamily)